MVIILGVPETLSSQLINRKGRGFGPKSSTGIQENGDSCRKMQSELLTAVSCHVCSVMDNKGYSNLGLEVRPILTYYLSVR